MMGFPKFYFTVAADQSSLGYTKEQKLSVDQQTVAADQSSLGYTRAV